MFNNIMNTVMDTNRTKDNDKARMDLQEYCKRSKLNLQQLGDSRLRKTKASYILSSTQRQDMCRWMQELKMLYSYTSNLGRCVNVAQGRFFRLKSHNCVFMECRWRRSFALMSCPE